MSSSSIDNDVTVVHSTAGVVEDSPDSARTNRGSSPMWIALVLTFVGVVFAVSWFAAGGADAEPVQLLPIAAAPIVPDFSLVAQDGQAITRADFNGKIWLANFIYAQCPGPCPTLTARMAAVQKALSSQKERVRMASFSLDPLRDTTAVLSDYARRFHVDGSWWYFLTGPSEEGMHEIVEKGFLQSVVPGDDDNPMMHSNYVAVVDARGRIRAFFDGMESGSNARIIAAVRQLLSEAESP